MSETRFNDLQFTPKEIVALGVDRIESGRAVVVCLFWGQESIRSFNPNALMITINVCSFPELRNINSCPKINDLGTSSSASHGNLLQMQILSPHLYLLYQNLQSNKVPRGLYTHWGLGSSVLDQPVFLLVHMKNHLCELSKFLYPGLF